MKKLSDKELKEIRRNNTKHLKTGTVRHPHDLEVQNLLTTIDKLKEEVSNARVIVKGSISIAGEAEKKTRELQAENERLKEQRERDYSNIFGELVDEQRANAGLRVELKALLKKKDKEIDGHIADKRGYIRDLKEKDERIAQLERELEDARD